MESKLRRDAGVKAVGRNVIIILNNKNNNKKKYQMIFWIESAFVGWAGEAGVWVGWWVGPITTTTENKNINNNNK